MSFVRPCGLTARDRKETPHVSSMHRKRGLAGRRLRVRGRPDRIRREEAARYARHQAEGEHTVTAQALPEIVSRDAWLAARKALLAREKEVTHLRDQVNAERRRLPMVEVTTPYVFEGPRGK